VAEAAVVLEKTKDQEDLAAQEAVEVGITKLQEALEEQIKEQVEDQLLEVTKDNSQEEMVDQV
jgi:hypothetical protein